MYEGCEESKIKGSIHHASFDKLPMDAPAALDVVVWILLCSNPADIPECVRRTHTALKVKENSN